MLADDGVGGGEFESGIEFLGGKIGIENFRDLFRAEALAEIADGNNDVGAGWQEEPCAVRE